MAFKKGNHTGSLIILFIAFWAWEYTDKQLGNAN